MGLFCDSDFLWFCDPMEILEKYKDESKAILCVKHEYSNCNDNVKMDGRKQNGILVKIGLV